MHLKSPCCQDQMELESLSFAIFRCVKCRRSWRNDDLVAAIDLRNPKSPCRTDAQKSPSRGLETR